MKRILRKLFPSLFPISEYVTGSAEGLPCMLKCVAVVDGKRIDFERQPLFLGYKPLVMAVCDVPEIIHLIPESSEVIFEYLNIKSGEKVAELKLRVDKILPVEDKLLALLVGISGTHQLESRWDRLAFGLNEMLTKKSSGNIDLTASEYDQLKIAYSIPREIKTLHLSKEETGNYFPIDLFGYIGTSHVVLSLRHAKKSAQQIMLANRIETRLVRAADAQITYALGRNHSADFRPLAVSPRPYGSDELQLVQTLGDYGVHRIFLFRIANRIQSPYQESEHLVHVHRSYANWHIRHGFPVKEILR